MSSNSGKDVFKASQEVASASKARADCGFAFEQVSKVESEVAAELKSEIAKFKDPTVFGALLYRTVRERESSNLLFKALLSKLESIESRLDALENQSKQASAQISSAGLQQNQAQFGVQVPVASAYVQQAQVLSSGQIQQQVLVPEIDAQIISFVQVSGHVSAEDVQSKFKYKGKNAASARLNRLCSINLLEKQQVGRKVYFRVRS
ncbi:hypothetical protein FJZ26_05370 [Candidatus Parvarchaeota archaeon]|nr:hypothetical protein [Candidatus Parvarchaeota archaeon]